MKKNKETFEQIERSTNAIKEIHAELLDELIKLNNVEKEVQNRKQKLLEYLQATGGSTRL